MSILIRVAVNSKYPLDRSGIAAIISSLPGMTVVPASSDPPPSVLVWDFEDGSFQPPLHEPSSRVIALIREDQIPSFPPGIAGLFSKNESPEALGAAIRQVARGEQYLSASLAISLLRSQSQSETSSQWETSQLPEREREVFRLLAEGLSNKAIAARLYLSVRTVEGHLERLYTRLGVHSRAEAIVVAMRQKEPPPNR